MGCWPTFELPQPASAGPMSRPADRLARRLKAAENSPPLVVHRPRNPTGILAQRIVAVLRRDPARSWTVHELVVEVKKGKPAVKKELCRLLLPGRDDTPPPVQRTGRGLYAAFVGPEELARIESPTPKVHALQLVWPVPGSPPFGGSPPRSPPTAEAAFGVGHGRSWVHDEESRSYRVVRWHGPLKITLQAFPTTGKLLASVDSSENPLDAQALGTLRTWLEATLQAEGFPWTEPRVATVEINRDYHRVRLNGREAARFYLGRMGLSGEQHLRLGHLEGALVQIYNKERLGVMRQELRLQPRDLDLPNLQALVVSMFYGPLSDTASRGTPPPPEGGYA